MLPSSRDIFGAIDGVTKQLVAVLNDTALTPAPLSLRARAALLAARYRATGELDDFLAATLIEAFLELNVDETKLNMCLETILESPYQFGMGLGKGWIAGVLEILDDVIKGYETMFAELGAFLTDFWDFYTDYVSALTDLGVLREVALTVQDSDDRSLDDTIARIHAAVSAKHSDLAMIMLYVLDRLNVMSLLIKVFRDKRNEEIVRGLIVTLGPTLRGYWQSDIDRYLLLGSKNAFKLGFEIGKDYGRLTAEATLIVIGA